MGRSFIKDPQANLDYGVNWGGDAETPPWLKTGETIASSTWIVPPGLTKVDETTTDTIAWVWLSGGTAGENYSVTNRITTNQNRADDRTFRIYVRER